MRVDISIYRQDMVGTAGIYTVVGVILTLSSLRLGVDQSLIGSIADNQIANVQEMDRAIDQETSTELRVTQEEEEMAIEQETQITFLGSDLTYNRFIASMGITHEMIRNSIGQIHEDIIRISPSAYQEEDLPVGQEIEWRLQKWR